MRLRNKSFERAARRRIRAELRLSRQLQKDYRQVRKLRRQNLTTRPWMARLFFTFLVGSGIFLAPRSIEQIVALIVLWELGWILIRVSLLNAGLHFSSALTVFNLLPISDQDIFKAQWRSFLRASLWSALDFSILYYGLAVKTGSGIHSLATGIALGTVEWFFIVSLALCLVVVGVRKFFYNLALLFIVSALGLLFFFPYKQIVAEWIARAAYWLPPVGWLVHAMGITASRGLVLDLLPALLSAIVLVLFPLAYSRMRRKYSLNERIVALASVVSSSTRPGIVEYPEAAQEFIQPAKEAAARINSGELRVSLDCGLRSFAIFLLVLVSGSWLFATVASSISGTLLAFGAFYFLGAFAGQWRGFASPRGGGLQSPFYALYPIGIWELLLLVLKINLLRFLLYLPFIVGAAFFLLERSSLGWSMTLLTSAKFFLVGLFSQPILAITQISPGTNDGQKPRVVFAALIFLLILVPALITIIASTTFWVLLIACLVFAAASCGALLLYCRLFNNNRFDLVPGRLQTGSAH